MKKLLLIINRVIYISATAMLIAGLIFTFNGQPTVVRADAIWTTRDDCGDGSQDVNLFNRGDDVFINGSGFAPGEYTWDITGKPGGASCDPGLVVAEGTINVPDNGIFCFPAYTIAIDDCGEYQVKVGVKGDNYRVGDPPTNTPTSIPTSIPTSLPTNIPTSLPTSLPTNTPTSMATNTPPPPPPPTDIPTVPATLPPPVVEPQDVLIPVTGADLTPGMHNLTWGGLGMLGLGMVLTGIRRKLFGE